MENVQTESPAAYESQSNGGIEVGIKIVRGLFRTLKRCLEQRLGKYVPTDHALMPWLLQHTCSLPNAKARGPDGLTCWERIKGRKFNQLVLGFAETVLYKQRAQSEPQPQYGHSVVGRYFLWIWSFCEHVRHRHRR